MQLATVGPGRMGANMVIRLVDAGHDNVVFDHNKEKGRRRGRRRSLSRHIQNERTPSDLSC